MAALIVAYLLENVYVDNVSDQVFLDASKTLPQIQHPSQELKMFVLKFCEWRRNKNPYRILGWIGRP